MVVEAVAMRVCNAHAYHAMHSSKMHTKNDVLTRLFYIKNLRRCYFNAIVLRSFELCMDIKIYACAWHACIIYDIQFINYKYLWGKNLFYLVHLCLSKNKNACNMNESHNIYSFLHQQILLVVHTCNSK